MAYVGADRRIHKVFLTRNTEYHLRRGFCVAVRDRRSGRWLDTHHALWRRVDGSVTFFGEGGMSASAKLPDIGEALCFDGLSLVTSPVVEVGRPPKEVVETYPASQAA